MSALKILLLCPLITLAIPVEDSTVIRKADEIMRSTKNSTEIPDRLVYELAETIIIMFQAKTTRPNYLTP